METFNQNQNNEYFLNLGRKYQLEENYELMKENYEKAIELNNVKAMVYYSIYFEKIEKDFILSSLYLSRACALNNIFAIKKIALILYKQKKYNLSIMNFCSAFSLGDRESLIYLKTLFKITKLRLYIILNNIKNKNKFVIKELNYLKKELKKNNSLKNYFNKIKLFKKLNYIRECPICFKNDININFTCSHTVCSLCYTKVNKCPICREDNEDCKDLKKTYYNLSDSESEEKDDDYDFFQLDESQIENNNEIIQEDSCSEDENI
jgi:hypothetical protein